MKCRRRRSCLPCGQDYRAQTVSEAPRRSMTSAVQLVSGWTLTVISSARLDLFSLFVYHQREWLLSIQHIVTMCYELCVSIQTVSFTCISRVKILVINIWDLFMGVEHIFACFAQIMNPYLNSDINLAWMGGGGGGGGGVLVHSSLACAPTILYFTIPVSG